MDGFELGMSPRTDDEWVQATRVMKEPLEVARGDVHLVRRRPPPIRFFGCAELARGLRAATAAREQLAVDLPEQPEGQRQRLQPRQAGCNSWH
jgi:hypothetical protein